MMFQTATEPGPYQADVCLLLEGTYPYVSGGVSTWVHHLVSALSSLTFCGVVILPSKEQEWKSRYDLPPNFVGLDHVYVHDYKLDKTRRRLPGKKKAARVLADFHRGVKQKKPEVIENLMPLLFPERNRPLSTEDMIYSKESWDLLLDLYEPHKNEDSFIDFFWTFRFNHLPIFQILDAPKPRARVYHAVSTGYAGLMGVLLARRHNRPLLLTEHGIYTKERKIEIAQAEWIYLANRDEIKVSKELGTFQRQWINIFRGIGLLTYHSAAEVITLYEGNRRLQIEDGCPDAKIRIIPNGIKIERFAQLKADPLAIGDIWRIGFVGRVVSIKDVKTFLRACKLVSLRKPNTEFYVIGPTDEEEEYYRDCLALTETLDLAEKVSFTGLVKVTEYYPKLDLICLTSISEAQPLVILEANCVGIPVVATDVGACAELLNGRSPEDKALGPSGLIADVADPWSVAQAVLKILENDDLRRRMIQAGRERVSLFYREEKLNEQYLEIYGGYLNENNRPAVG